MELKNKRVLVVGLGKSGKSAALFLRDRGARVTVSDARSAEALAGEIPALLDAGIMVETGGHGLLTFRRQDLIVVSPGVPYDTPELKQVRAFGLPIIGELELASRFLQGQIVAITGSNGKTTTTALLGKIFADAGGPTLVGGNIGTPVIDLIAQSTPQTVSVLEVSSFQLETVEEFRPHIAVVLNITQDHLDRHGTLRELRGHEGADHGAADAGGLLRAQRRGQADPDACRADQGAGLLVQRAAADQAGRICAWRERRLPPARGSEAGAGDAVGGDSAQGRAQRGERARGGLRGPAGRHLVRVDSRLGRRLQGSRASPGVCGHRARRRVLTTTPRRPTWTRPRRPWRRSRAACT